jgi:hypothetical protein
MTQKEQLLKYFNEVDNNITSLECMQDLIILDLQSVIRDLKKDGHTIYDFWVSRKNRFGRSVSFKRYYLIKDDIDYRNFLQESERNDKHNRVIKALKD